MLWDTIKLVLRKINVKDENLGYVKTLLYYRCKKKLVQPSIEIFTNIYESLGLFIFVHPIITGTGIYPKETTKMLMFLYIKMFITMLIIHYTLKRQTKPWRKWYKLLTEREYVNSDTFILCTIMQTLKWCL